MELDIYWAFWGVPAILFAGIGKGFARKHRQQKQDERDASSPGYFSLYLRPFFVDGRLHLKTPRVWKTVMLPSYWTVDHTVELEEQIARTMQDIYPLRAIAGQSRSIGAGRTTSSNEHWRAKEATMIDKAKILLLYLLQPQGLFGKSTR